MWYRVFGTNHVQPEPASLLDSVRRLETGHHVEGKFSADDAGWFRADLDFEQGMMLLTIDRYLANEEGIRAELNAWAAWLETVEHDPNHGGLMQHMIRTTQVFTFDGPRDADCVLPMAHVYPGLCRFLAAATDGVYQVDAEGFYSADGALLLKEEE